MDPSGQSGGFLVDEVFGLPLEIPDGVEASTGMGFRVDGVEVA